MIRVAVSETPDARWSVTVDDVVVLVHAQEEVARRVALYDHRDLVELRDLARARNGSVCRAGECTPGQRVITMLGAPDPQERRSAEVLGKSGGVVVLRLAVGPLVHVERDAWVLPLPPLPMHRRLFDALSAADWHHERSESQRARIEGEQSVATALAVARTVRPHPEADAWWRHFVPPRVRAPWLSDASQVGGGRDVAVLVAHAHVAPMVGRTELRPSEDDGAVGSGVGGKRARSFAVLRRVPLGRAVGSGARERWTPAPHQQQAEYPLMNALPFLATACMLARVTRGWGVYLSHCDDEDVTSDELHKAAPLLDAESLMSLHFEGAVFVVMSDKQDAGRLYDCVVGDDGPTPSNCYDGPARIFATLVGPTGPIMENT